MFWCKFFSGVSTARCLDTLFDLPKARCAIIIFALGAEFWCAMIIFALGAEFCIFDEYFVCTLREHFYKCSHSNIVSWLFSLWSYLFSNRMELRYSEGPSKKKNSPHMQRLCIRWIYSAGCHSIYLCGVQKHIW